MQWPSATMGYCVPLAPQPTWSRQVDLELQLVPLTYTKRRKGEPEWHMSCLHAGFAGMAGWETRPCWHVLAAVCQAALCHDEKGHLCMPAVAGLAGLGNARRAERTLRQYTVCLACSSRDWTALQ